MPRLLIIEIIIGVLVIAAAAAVILAPTNTVPKYPQHIAALRRHRQRRDDQALGGLLEMLRYSADRKTTRALLDAAASYGRHSLLANPLLAELPVESARSLGARVAELEAEPR